jgi:hypothetical protein
MRQLKPLDPVRTHDGRVGVIYSISFGEDEAPPQANVVVKSERGLQLHCVGNKFMTLAPDLLPELEAEWIAARRLLIRVGRLKPSIKTKAKA